MPMPSLIDVHHHAVPPAVRTRLAGRRVADVGGVPVPRWDEARELEVLDRQDVRAAVLSLSDAGPAASDARLMRLLSRETNEFYADLVARHPGRFAALASLPLPDVDAALGELEYALDVLRLDGVMLLSNHGGRYPGDPVFEPVLAELDRRSAVAFLHPATPRLTPTPDLPTFLLDYPFETTRAVASLLRAGALRRYPNVRLLLAHAGGAAPYLAARLALGQAPPRARAIAERFAGAPAGGTAFEAVADAVVGRNERRVGEALGRLYYDTALSVGRPTLRALDALVGPERVVFGSDYPYAPEPLIGRTARKVAAEQRQDSADQIFHQNALGLFPRLRGTFPEAPDVGDLRPNGRGAQGKLRRSVRAFALRLGVGKEPRKEGP